MSRVYKGRVDFLKQTHEDGCWEVTRNVQGYWDALDSDDGFKLKNFASMHGAVLGAIHNWSMSVVVKTASPDYRDWELVFTPKGGYMFTGDDLFRMQLDVSTEDFFK